MKVYRVRRRDYPDICPKCGSKQIEYWGPEAGGGYIEDAVSCKDCDFTWATSYKYLKWIPTGKYAE